jgi:hypothetical protein
MIGVHKKGGLDKVNTAVPFTRQQVQRYIQFARYDDDDDDTEIVVR